MTIILTCEVCETEFEAPRWLLRELEAAGGSVTCPGCLEDKEELTGPWGDNGYPHVQEEINYAAYR